MLRQEEAAWQIMGLLIGLDTVKFLLLVDPDQDTPRTAGRGLIGGLRHYLPQPWARPEPGRLDPSPAQKHTDATPVPVRLYTAHPTTHLALSTLLQCVTS